MRRRPLLAGTGAALLAALAACSKDEPAATAPPAAAGGTSRQTFDAASRGTGFAVGPSMAARTVLVFFDPQCPHCAALWQASRPLLDRIRMVWMPVAFINASSAPQGVLLLAAADPRALMDEHEDRLAKGEGGLAVPGPADAQRLTQVKANTELWQRLDGRSVPHLIYRTGVDGRYGVQAGGMPTAQLAQLLEL